MQFRSKSMQDLATLMWLYDSYYLMNLLKYDKQAELILVRLSYS